MYYINNVTSIKKTLN